MKHTKRILLFCFSLIWVVTSNEILTLENAVKRLENNYEIKIPIRYLLKNKCGNWKCGMLPTVATVLDNNSIQNSSQTSGRNKN
jgi:hypothetical protein